MSARKGLRLHIGVFGRRNVGKSSVLNAFTRQNTSIVSDIAGTTTDPVEKPMELLPLGPVLFIDTAGVDDSGVLGELRVKKTTNVFDRTDLAVIVLGDDTWSEYEEVLLREFVGRQTPIVVARNKSDLCAPSAALEAELRTKGVATVTCSAVTGQGIAELRLAILEACPEEFKREPDLLGDLITPGGVVVLVVPIDKEAPKGRLILPQVQAIRNALDNDAICVVTKERELKRALSQLRTEPDLVVTDSQAFLKVAADTPVSIPLTSFSILFARLQGDLVTQVRGAAAIERLRTGDKILIAEACSHHPIGEDIGRVKIPRWLTQYVGGMLEFEHVQGHDFPDDLSEFRLVVHCGACMWNRKEMLSRIMRCSAAGVPVTNYGLSIAFSLGIFDRALEPFPAAKAVYRKESEGSSKSTALRKRTQRADIDSECILQSGR